MLLAALLIVVLLTLTVYAVSTVARVEQGSLLKIYRSEGVVEASLSPPLARALRMWNEKKSLILSVTFNDPRVQEALLANGRWEYLGVLFSGRIVNGAYSFEAYTLVFKLPDEELERRGYEEYLYVYVSENLKVLKVEEKITPRIPNEPASQVDKGYWAGYAFYEAGYPSYYGVSGAIDVVPVALPPGASAAQVWSWVGLSVDLEGSTIVQSGWTAWYDSSTGGTFRYAAWVWLFKASGSSVGIVVPRPVKPGDKLIIDVLYDPSMQQYLVFLSNPTEGWSEMATISASLSTPYACFIVESGRSGYWLPQFTSIGFHDMTVYTSYVSGTWQGHSVEKNYWAGAYVRYLMWYSGSTYNAVPYFNDPDPSRYWDAWISVVYQHS